MTEDNKAPLTPDDWKALLGDQDRQHEAADILNQPMTREEEEEAYPRKWRTCKPISTRWRVLRKPAHPSR